MILMPMLSDRYNAASALAHSVVKRRLALVYWDLGGDWRLAKTHCVGHLLAAAKLNPKDALAFALLGPWYQAEAGDLVRAEKSRRSRSTQRARWPGNSYRRCTQRIMRRTGTYG